VHKFGQKKSQKTCVKYMCKKKKMKKEHTGMMAEQLQGLVCTTWNIRRGWGVEISNRGRTRKDIK